MSTLPTKNKETRDTKVIQPISETETQQSEEVCTEQLNLTCLSKCIMVGGNPLSCKVACGKTICMETHIPEEDAIQEETDPDAFIFVDTLDDGTTSDVCLTNSDCFTSCIESGDNPVACKTQCTSCPSSEEGNTVPVRERDDFTPEEKERLCS